MLVALFVGCVIVAILVGLGVLPWEAAAVACVLAGIAGGFMAAPREGGEE